MPINQKYGIEKLRILFLSSCVPYLIFEFFHEEGWDAGREDFSDINHFGGRRIILLEDDSLAGHAGIEDRDDCD